MPYIHECGVEAGHRFANTRKENVAYREVGLGLLLMQFYKSSIFKQCDLHICGSRIDDQ